MEAGTLCFGLSGLREGVLANVGVCGRSLVVVCAFGDAGADDENWNDEVSSVLGARGEPGFWVSEMMNRSSSRNGSRSDPCGVSPGASLLWMLGSWGVAGVSRSGVPSKREIQVSNTPGFFCTGRSIGAATGTARGSGSSVRSLALTGSDAMSKSVRNPFFGDVPYRMPSYNSSSCSSKLYVCGPPVRAVGAGGSSSMVTTSGASDALGK